VHPSTAIRACGLAEGHAMDFEGSATMSAGQKDGRESSMDLAALGEIVELLAGK